MTNQTTTKYRIRNWAEYNKALVQRGSLTIWFSPEAVDKWLAGKEGKRGRPTVYSDEAILCARIKPWMQWRNNALRQIAGLGEDEDARKLWKKLAGYHRRSIAETAMFRFKKLFGGSLACRVQKAEVFSKCLVINRMNSLGMPKGKWINV